MEDGPLSAAAEEGRTLSLDRLRDSFGLILFLVFVTYVLTSLLGDRGWSAVVLSAATSVTSIAALAGARVGRRPTSTAAGVAASAIVLAVLGAAIGSGPWREVALALQVLLLATATGAVLLRVLASAETGRRTVLGAIAVYSVLGLLFSYAYTLIDQVQSGPFFEANAAPGKSDFIFFSYTTLTTTGYGNLVPDGQPGRMVAGIEMVMGQIFLVTLVAGLVSLWRPGERLRERRRPDQG